MRFIHDIADKSLVDSLLSLDTLLGRTYLNLFFLRSLSTYPEYETWRSDHYIQVLRFISKHKVRNHFQKVNVAYYFSEKACKKIKDAQKGSLELLKAKLAHDKELFPILLTPDFGALVAYVNTP